MAAPERLLLLVLAAAGAAAAGRTEDAPLAVVPVPYAEVLEAIRSNTGYNRLATTHGARLQSAVLLHLAKRARERDPAGPPLIIRHDDWFRALLEATDIGPDRAPLYAVLAHRHRQDIVAEYRDGRVVREVVRGPAPRLALDVTITWPDAPGAPRQYSYEDTLSTPHLKVTNKRVIAYRLLDFGDMVAFEEMEGLTGRPTTGALGLLFQIIGEGRIVEYRMAVAPSGVTVSRGRARKGFFEVATTVTVQPDGRSERGVPADPVLKAIAKRLERPMEVRFHPRQ